MLTVVNSYGVEISYEMAVDLMDDETREAVHSYMAPCTEQEFFNAYAAAHLAEFGEVWEADTANPQY